jgi:hypothetical protein
MIEDWKTEANSQRLMPFNHQSSIINHQSPKP